MKQEKENFEFVKDPEDTKKNYIFQKDSITKKTALFISVILILLILAVILTGVFFKFN